jgi:hypothetical protein
MQDTQPADLWSVSEFERVHAQARSSAFNNLDGPTLLPTTLLADLRRLDAFGHHGDVLEVVAACMRHREAALLCLELDGRVWPVTLFPAQMLYHSPRDLATASATTLARLTLLRVEPPGVRPPGHWMHERVAEAEHYRPLEPLAWSLAIDGPRATLLAEISGTAAYRALKSPVGEGLTLGGAMRSAAQRLRRETVSLRAICEWPGMSPERASRLLNGLYLHAALLVTRAHPAARDNAGARGWRDLLRWPKRGQ